MMKGRTCIVEQDDGNCSCLNKVVTDVDSRKATVKKKSNTHLQSTLSLPDIPQHRLRTTIKTHPIISVQRLDSLNSVGTPAYLIFRKPWQTGGEDEGRPTVIRRSLRPGWPNTPPLPFLRNRRVTHVQWVFVVSGIVITCSARHYLQKMQWHFPHLYPAPIPAPFPDISPSGYVASVTVSCIKRRLIQEDIRVYVHDRLQADPRLKSWRNKPSIDYGGNHRILTTSLIVTTEKLSLPKLAKEGLADSDN